MDSEPLRHHHTTVGKYGISGQQTVKLASLGPLGQTH